MKKSLLIAIWALASTNLAYAAVSGNLEQQANGLLSAGNAPAAYQLLRPAIGASDGPQAWGLLGKAAETSGDRGAAIAAYREVLRRDPNANRVKLDLARLLGETGQPDESERLFREVRSLNPPAPVAANIDRYLALLSDRNRTGSEWRARVSIGTGYDSNANQGTSARVVDMYGLPFALSKTARRQGSFFVNLKAEFDHIYRFSPQWAWISNLSISGRKYTDVSNVDSYSVYAATGPVWQPSDRATVMLPFFTSVSRFENSAMSSAKRFYSNEYGVAPQIRYALSPAWNLNLTGIAARRHYFEQHNKDTTVLSLSPGLDYRTDGFGTFSVGATLGKELSGQRVYSNNQLGANVGWQNNLTKECAASVYGQYLDSRYAEAELAYSEKRHDRKIVAGGDLLCNLGFLSAELLLSYQRTWNLSNLPIYQYHKDVVSATLRKTF